MQTKAVPSRQTIMRHLVYSADDGLLRWILPPKYSSVRAGQIAGTKMTDSSGKTYIVVYLLGKPYYAHRLVWCIKTGLRSGFTIDHKNGDGTDNRILNLRSVTNTVNARNRSLSSNNTSGVSGVTKMKSGRWIARISFGGRRVYLGVFKTKSKAVAARKAAEAFYWGEER